jgi:hypothetical protein
MQLSRLKSANQMFRLILCMHLSMYPLVLQVSPIVLIKFHGESKLCSSSYIPISDDCSQTTSFCVRKCGWQTEFVIHIKHFWLFELFKVLVYKHSTLAGVWPALTFLLNVTFRVTFIIAKVNSRSISVAIGLVMLLLAIIQFHQCMQITCLLHLQAHSGRRSIIGNAVWLMLRLRVHP